MSQKDQQAWGVRLIGPRLPWGGQPVRPAEIGSELRYVMVRSGNTLEDANYQKIAPNHYIIEISPANYTHNYQPLENQLLQQWNEILLENLLTVNNRQGRREYRFGGPVRIEIRPSTELRDDQARILSRVALGSPQDPPVQEDLPACLEAQPDRRRWRLHGGVMTIGREISCDIHLNTLMIQQKRLVSGLHAYLQVQQGEARLFDGTPDGKPSTNGTFVNSLPVPSEGIILQDGDLIVLAALDPSQPAPNTPGVAAFIFRSDCSQAGF